MPLDPYSPCPCGSGKKFRFCCQDIFQDIDRAFALDQDGQHETALRAMEEVVRKHPSNPEALGRQAALLYANGRVEDAESALQKAFALNADYPFGYLLRGQMRENEGEIAGAVVLYRKAADRYSPEARDILAQVYMLIAEAELKLNRPVAGRAALSIMLHLHPNEEAHKSFDEAFGEQSRFPAAARRAYTFLPLPASAPAERRAAWDRILQGAATGRLRDAAQAFAQVTTEAPDDAAGWYNLALARAWLGENASALEALDRYVTLEADEAKAAAAWELGEVLRLGQGLEDQADYVQQTVSFQVRQPQAFFQFMNQWGQERRFFGNMTDESQTMITGLVLEKVTALTAESAAAKPPRIAAYYVLVGELFQVRGVNAELLDQVVQEVQQRAGSFLSPPDRRRGPAGFGDVLSAAVVIPINALSEDDARRKVREHMERYFEETWIQRPLKSLGGVPPVDAAGHPVLRKKLSGVVQFLHDCLALGQDSGYDFNRLRRKLGLLGSDAAPAAPAGEGGAPALDVTALSAAELANLAPEALPNDQLELAFQTANRLDARELAARFGRQLITRPAQGDRYTVYSKLIDLALGDRDTDTALELVDQGEKADCEQNEGRRRNDFELRRGQVLAKRGEPEAARDVFQRLVERAPTELRYRGSAAEAMLSAKSGTAALAFAESGLAEARKQQNRDSEGYFLELVAAAKKQGG